MQKKKVAKRARKSTRTGKGVATVASTVKPTILITDPQFIAKANALFEEHKDTFTIALKSLWHLTVFGVVLFSFLTLGVGFLTTSFTLLDISTVGSITSYVLLKYFTDWEFLVKECGIDVYKLF